jgi:hypothetical protein
MSYSQSPFSGEFGDNSPGARAVRLEKSPLCPIEAIMLDRSQLPANPLVNWGFELVKTRDAAVPIPKLSFGADVRSRFDVDFLDTDGSAIGGFVFDEAHPDPWWKAVHENEWLMLVVGDVTALVNAETFDEQREIFGESYIGVAPLVIWGFNEGVGTAAPGQ